MCVLIIYIDYRRENMDSINTEHGIFTNNDVTGQTAEEVYQNWLENKDKPPKPKVDERIEALEQAMLEIAMGGM